MADQTQKNKYAVSSSPKGVLVYPRVATPDFKFKTEGQYSTKLLLTGQEAEDFRAKVERMHIEAFEAEKQRMITAVDADGNPDGKRRAAAKKMTMGKPPYDMEVDDEGNETGGIIFKFSRTASGIARKTGKPWKQTIRLFDAAGNPVKDVNPWGGTVARVGFFTSAYYVPASGQAGVSMKLDAVKIINLVSQGERNASAYGAGFGEAEEGYTGDSAPAASEGDSAPAAGGSDEEAAEDF